MITRNFNLYLNAGHSVPLVINVNQYDSGEQWVFTLYNADGTKYTPSTGAIVGIKSDGLGIINSGSVVDGNVVISETQQMTAAVGKAVFELMIDSQTHGTANFVVLVEEKPGNNADLSDSDLSLIQEALDAVNPLPTGGTVGQVLTKTANGSAWSDAGTPTQEQVADAVSDWADEHITVSTGVVIDTSLSVAGAAADSKKVGDEITDLKSAIQSSGGFNAEVKSALETLLEHVAYTDEHGQDYLDALHAAMYPPANLTSISAVYTQGGVVHDTDSLNSLRDDLVVTAHYSDSTTAVVTNYVLSGTLTEGTSTITVSYGGKTTTFNVVVSGEYELLYTLTPNDMVLCGSASNVYQSATGGYYYVGNDKLIYPDFDLLISNNHRYKIEISSDTDQANVYLNPTGTATNVANHSNINPSSLGVQTSPYKFTVSYFDNKESLRVLNPVADNLEHYKIYKYRDLAECELDNSLWAVGYITGTGLANNATTTGQRYTMLAIPVTAGHTYRFANSNQSWETDWASYTFVQSDLSTKSARNTMTSLNDHFDFTVPSGYSYVLISCANMENYYETATLTDVTE